MRAIRVIFKLERAGRLDIDVLIRPMEQVNEQSRTSMQKPNRHTFLVKLYSFSVYFSVYFRVLY